MAILYTIRRQIAISTNIEIADLKSMTFIQANITLSTLLGFNLLVAIRANTTQFSYFVILNIA